MTAGPAYRVEVHPQAGVKGQVVERGVSAGETEEVAGGEVGEYCEEDLGGHVEERGGTLARVAAGRGGWGGRWGGHWRMVLICGEDSTLTSKTTHTERNIRGWRGKFNSLAPRLSPLVII